MKRFFLCLTALCLALCLAACGSYSPVGEETGHEALDAQVLEVLQQVCKKDAPLQENLSAVYHWVAEEIRYRASTADTSEGFTEELTAKLAAEAISKRRGACDSEAALMAVLLRRMGCQVMVVEGQFYRAENGDWVDHAWVVARVDGAYRHFDPLYGRYYAEDRMADYCMATDAALENSHTWDRAQYPACN